MWWGYLSNDTQCMAMLLKCCHRRLTVSDPINRMGRQALMLKPKSIQRNVPQNFVFGPQEMRAFWWCLQGRHSDK